MSLPLKHKGLKVQNLQKDYELDGLVYDLLDGKKNDQQQK